uniref:Uncharacterized protein n=1 Tax=Anguilla anguilla TaxID=7936 RepID=A0A0E9TNV8_ANGAN
MKHEPGNRGVISPNFVANCTGDGTWVKC